jgi:hypothetical protein
MSQTPNSLAKADAATQAEDRKLLSIGIAGAIVAAIVFFECATVYLYLAGGDFLGKAEARRTVAANEQIQMRDVDLGKFSLTAVDPNSSSGSLLIEFHLIGSVVAGYSGKEATGGAERDRFDEQGSKSGDVAEDGNTAFEKLFQRERSRFRDQVIVVIGNAQISALSEPGFELIKGQLLARTNSLLGKPLVKEIRFSEFAVVQQ